jgi:hypothetical protein
MRHVSKSGELCALMRHVWQVLVGQNTLATNLAIIKALERVDVCFACQHRGGAEGRADNSAQSPTSVAAAMPSVASGTFEGGWTRPKGGG